MSGARTRQSSCQVKPAPDTMNAVIRLLNCAAKELNFFSYKPILDCRSFAMLSILRTVSDGSLTLWHQSQLPWHPTALRRPGCALSWRGSG